ncbi:MAG: tRNA uridine-5-carboxymethylaminomethyl(34) synthesis enzyme MnmG, partial [Clostridiales bacterium]|nr:tRNA uridine-5-carboxymethylaminomethyl(34) synthesis enzyme MnmG [Clostridiales bacterium]
YRDSIDFSLMEPQYGEEGLKFSFMTKEAVANRECCYLTYTNERTHEIIKENIHRAPMYNGAIEGIGPRYCPSIEDKVMRFKDKERHQIFVEPEGYQSEEMYIQGMSTSLPHDVQEKMYRTIKGLEKARFARYAYAIEYDCIEPQSLSPALAIKGFGGLFSAGQFNGTSGYEEAAAQGIIAGINAARYLEDKDYYIPTRDTSYIGVLIDDIVTKGTKEPYRMMTSRAEHRIILRQDNADMRLTEIAYNLGLATFERYQRLNLKKAEMARIEKLAKKPLEKSDALIRIFERGGEELPQRITLMELMKRAFVTLDDLIELCPDAANDTEALEAVFIEKKYEGYVKKQEAAIAEQRRLENKQLPEDIDYLKIDGLRLEARQKLNAVRPLNLGQASRISGVSPADISVLIVYLQKHGL